MGWTVGDSIIARGEMEALWSVLHERGGTVKLEEKKHTVRRGTTVWVGLGVTKLDAPPLRGVTAPMAHPLVTYLRPVHQNLCALVPFLVPSRVMYPPGTTAQRGFKSPVALFRPV